MRQETMLQCPIWNYGKRLLKDAHQNVLSESSAPRRLFHQCRESLPSFTLILPKKRKLSSLFDTNILSQLRNMPTIFIKIRFETVKGSSGLEDSHTVFGIALQEKLKSSKIIKEATHMHH